MVVPVAALAEGEGPPVTAEPPVAQSQPAQPAAAPARAAEPAQSRTGEAPVADKQSGAEQAPVSEEPQVDPRRVLNDQKLNWFRTIQALAFGAMARGSDAEYQDAEKQLLGITDPNALEPMALVLYTRNMRWRSSFLKSVQQYAKSKDDFAQKLAVTYLSDIAVGDISGVLRGKARATLVQADTPRYPERLRYRLISSPDAEVRSRAAQLLADLKDTQMLEAMIELLTTQEWRLKGAEIESRTVQMDLRPSVAGVPTFGSTTVTAAVPMGLASATIMLPNVRITQLQTTVFAPAGMQITPDWEEVTVRHPGMLLALQKLTGKDFGYNKEAWLEWLRTREGRQDPSRVDWSEGSEKPDHPR
jgi:hypothetical protein